MRLFLLAVALFSSACNCSEAAQLEVEGAHPYVRCHLAEPPATPERLGAMRLRLRERRLIFEGAPGEVRLVAFAGPIGELSGVEALEPDLVLVLGDVSGGRATLAALGVPVILVGGGLDTFESLRAAGEGTPDNVIDGSGLRSIRFGPLELVPVAGAPAGRYALEGGCGLGADDVGTWELDAPADGVSRVLASWAAPQGPRGSVASLGLERAEAGSELVSQVMEAAGAQAVLFAWPTTRAGAVDEDGPRIALRRLEGAPMIRGDGSRAPLGATALRVHAGGVSLVGDPP